MATEALIGHEPPRQSPGRILPHVVRESRQRVDLGGVLIDRVKHNETDRNMTIRESLLEAAGIRMRPILMTAIATVGSMLPLVFGSAESGSIVSQSLAIVVIGGLVVSTLLTLVIMRANSSPLACYRKFWSKNSLPLPSLKQE